MNGAAVSGVVGRVAGLGAGAGLTVAVAGCGQAPAAVPPTVIVNTPPADGGPVVLATVMVAFAFVAGLVAVVCAWGWRAERRARREAEAARRQAEDAVVALTGSPVAYLRSGLLGAGTAELWPVRRQLGQARRPAETGSGAGVDR